MPKMTDYLALREKYQREGVPQNISIEFLGILSLTELFR